MNIERGDVINARFPHASGTRGKKRPVVVVQANAYNVRLRHAVVAQLTTNLADSGDPACLLIEARTPEGIAAGSHAGQPALRLLALLDERGSRDRRDWQTTRSTLCARWTTA